MFPFLIGRIRTLHQVKDVHIKIKGFPFLIGRIRTSGISPHGILLSVFPFLIGRIRT